MADQDRAELIIVRRRTSLEGAESHNSVWKIAYADFMTAMMAFFLVMWLISATNQETRESVASYFNPIKLADSTPDRKGINDARRVDPGKAVEDDSLRPKPEPGQSTQQMQRPQAPQPRLGEAALFRDPYAALSEIAGAPPRNTEAGIAPDAARKEGWKGGEAFRDPFDPTSWPTAPATPSDTKGAGSRQPGGLLADEDALEPGDAKGARVPADKAGAAADPVRDADPAKDIAKDPSRDPGKESAKETAKGSSAARDKQDTAKAVGLFADDDSRSNPAANRSAAPQGDKGTAALQQNDKKPAQSEASKLQAAISAALAPLGAVRPVAEVRASNEGLLVSLTDDVNYGMFANGSAEPTAGLVRAIDKIAPLIAQTQGQVIVRGHTDNRPYRSADYDNWRLSTARAHMAHYMLIRGGLDARRIEHIEGFADRRPKNPNDPSAAENRRIDLLIRTPQP